MPLDSTISIAKRRKLNGPPKFAAPRTQFVRSVACCAPPKFFLCPQARSLKQKATCMQAWERKIAFAFPHLLVESIVRIDRREPDGFLPHHNGQSSRALFLVEHAGGIVCCRLCLTDKRRVALRGIVDLEIRRSTLRAHATIDIHR
jgi:hypothetical protein